VGGLTNAIAIHDLCQQAGIACWVGGMLESAIGGRICMALATLSNFTYPADIFPSRRFYQRDLAAPEIELSTGDDGTPQAVCSPAPGIGAQPDPELLKKMCIQHAAL
jgi:O-succinylbenzoate synthase